MKNRGRFLLIVFFALTFFGVMHLLSLLDLPFFANMPGRYIVHLLGIGACFGCAIFTLWEYFINRRKDHPQ